MTLQVILPLEGAHLLPMGEDPSLAVRCSGDVKQSDHGNEHRKLEKAGAHVSEKRSGGVPKILIAFLMPHSCPFVFIPNSLEWVAPGPLSGSP